MSIMITAAQRDALYDDVLTHLSGIGDLWLAIEREDYATADRLGREFADDLTLILDDIGWGSESSEAVQLTTRTGLLRRARRRWTRWRAAGPRSTHPHDHDYENVAFLDGKRSSETVELTTQAAVLRRVLGKLRARAEQHALTEQEAINERQVERSRAQLVVDTCKEVLTALGEAASAEAISSSPNTR